MSALETNLPVERQVLGMHFKIFKQQLRALHALAANHGKDLSLHDSNSTDYAVPPSASDLYPIPPEQRHRLAINPNPIGTRAIVPTSLNIDHGEVVVSSSSSKGKKRLLGNSSASRKVVSKAKKSKSIPDSDESDGDDKEDDESISATHSDEPKVPISNVSITSGKPPIESVDKTASSCTSDAANQDAPMGDSIGNGVAITAIPKKKRIATLASSTTSENTKNTSSRTTSPRTSAVPSNNHSNRGNENSGTRVGNGVDDIKSSGSVSTKESAGSKVDGRSDVNRPRDADRSRGRDYDRDDIHGRSTSSSNSRSRLDDSNRSSSSGSNSTRHEDYRPGSRAKGRSRSPSRSRDRSREYSRSRDRRRSPSRDRREDRAYRDSRDRDRGSRDRDGAPRRGGRDRSRSPSRRFPDSDAYSKYSPRTPSLSRESRRDSWSADRSSERSSRPRSRSPDRSASRSLQLQDDLREPARSHRIQAVVRDSPRIDERAMKVERGFDWYAPPRRLNVIQHGENGRSLVVDSKEVKIQNLRCSKLPEVIFRSFNEIPENPQDMSKHETGTSRQPIRIPWQDEEPLTSGYEVRRQEPLTSGYGTRREEPLAVNANGSYRSDAIVYSNSDYKNYLSGLGGGSYEYNTNIPRPREGRDNYYPVSNVPAYGSTIAAVSTFSADLSDLRSRPVMFGAESYQRGAVYDMEYDTYRQIPHSINSSSGALPLVSRESESYDLSSRGPMAIPNSSDFEGYTTDLKSLESRYPATRSTSYAPSSYALSSYNYDSAPLSLTMPPVETSSYERELPSSDHLTPPSDDLLSLLPESVQTLSPNQLATLLEMLNQPENAALLEDPSGPGFAALLARIQ